MLGTKKGDGGSLSAPSPAALCTTPEREHTPSDTAFARSFSTVMRVVLERETDEAFSRVTDIDLRGGGQWNLSAAYIPRLTRPIRIVHPSSEALLRLHLPQPTPWIAQLSSASKTIDPMEHLIDNLPPPHTCLWSCLSPITAESFREEGESAGHVLGKPSLGGVRAQASPNVQNYKTAHRPVINHQLPEPHDIATVVFSSPSNLDMATNVVS